MKKGKGTKATKPTSKTKAMPDFRQKSEMHYAKARLYSAKADLHDAQNPPKPSSKGPRPY